MNSTMTILSFISLVAEGILKGLLYISDPYDKLLTRCINDIYTSW